MVEAEEVKLEPEEVEEVESGGRSSPPAEGASPRSSGSVSHSEYIFSTSYLQARTIYAKSNGGVSLSGDYCGMEFSFLSSFQNQNKFSPQMTEQYSAYQTLAAQAAITQQLRAASDTSQVGGQMG